MVASAQTRAESPTGLGAVPRLAKHPAVRHELSPAGPLGPSHGPLGLVYLAAVEPGL